MKLCPISPIPKPNRRLFRQTRVSNAMEAAFSAEIQKHGLSRIKALTMLLEQYNTNPWSFHPKPKREESLHYTWAAFAADVDLVDTFTAHCAAAGVSTGEGVRQIVQRCLDTASGKAAWDQLAAMLGPYAYLERREGLPNMGDLRKALEDWLVCLHLAATTAGPVRGRGKWLTEMSRRAATDGSVESLASADDAQQASVRIHVEVLEQRSDDCELLMDGDLWETCALKVYLCELAMVRLRREAADD